MCGVYSRPKMMKPGAPLQGNFRGYESLGRIYWGFSCCARGEAAESKVLRRDDLLKPANYRMAMPDFCCKRAPIGDFHK
jgi:hypothetical protein